MIGITHSGITLNNRRLGDGNGGFGAERSFSVRSNPWALAVGDFNNDGKVDIAVITPQTNSGSSVLVGDGTGGFVSLGLFNAGTTPSAVTVGDWNGDGKLDLAVANDEGRATAPA